MALPYSWTTISAGSKIVYGHIDEIRKNIDYLKDNAANRAYDSTRNDALLSTVNSTQYSGRLASQNASADGAQNATVYAPYQPSICNSQYSSVNGSVNAGVNASVNSSVLSNHYSGNNTPYTVQSCSTVYNSQGCQNWSVTGVSTP